MNGQKKVLLNPHRGDSINCPENTMASFVSAVEKGATTLEIDIAMTTDNRFVVIHDPSVNRTSDGSGYVEQMSYEQLSKFDYGAWFDSKYSGERIPLLEDVMCWAVAKNIGIVIEIKQRKNHDNFVQEFIKLFERNPSFNKVALLLSFDHTIINKIKSRIPDIRIQVVTLALYNNQLMAVLESNADSVCVEYPHLNRKTLEEYKKANLIVRMFFSTKENDTSLWFNDYYGYDAHGEIVSWIRDGLIDLISHDDVEYLKRLADEAGLQYS